MFKCLVSLKGLVLLERFSNVRMPGIVRRSSTARRPSIVKRSGYFRMSSSLCIPKPSVNNCAPPHTYIYIYTYIYIDIYIHR